MLSPCSIFEQLQLPAWQVNVADLENDQLWKERLLPFLAYLRRIDYVFGSWNEKNIALTSDLSSMPSSATMPSPGATSFLIGLSRYVLPTFAHSKLIICPDSLAGSSEDSLIPSLLSESNKPRAPSPGPHLSIRNPCSTSAATRLRARLHRSPSSTSSVSPPTSYHPPAYFTLRS